MEVFVRDSRFGVRKTSLQQFPKQTGSSKVIHIVGLMKTWLSLPGRKTSIGIKELLVAFGLVFRILRINHSQVSECRGHSEKPRAGLLELSHSGKGVSLTMEVLNKLGSIT